ncbi:MAG TPA: electron transfer flavoprotein subunit beta/FixA family protein [Candidatus Latescibacteria bacterium]|nr:electron transfer flavoprotein subunit beta/FixA family protein [Candidatus Latescibacterota bacterium]
MNILVFVKRVPDTESRIRIQHETKSIVEEGLNFVVSPYDEYAMEEALKLREAQGGTVRAVSVGKDEAVVVLRKCLAMGADEAFLVKDDSPETYDGLRTARIIARTVERKFAGTDLLLFGKQAVGTDNSQVPAMVAELLGLPQATVVTKLEVEGASATALREIEGGMEKIVLSLPAVVTAQKGLNEPRYETLKGIMAAKKKDIPVVKLEELGFGPDELVSQVDVTGLDVPAQRQCGRILTGEPAETARELVGLLRTEAKII